MRDYDEDDYAPEDEDERSEVRRMLVNRRWGNTTRGRTAPFEVEVDLADPDLTPFAVATLQLGKQLVCQSLLTRREIMAGLPEQERQRLQEQAEVYGLDLDAHDVVDVFAGASYVVRQDTPVQWLNRRAELAIPDGYYPFRSHGIGGPVRTLEPDLLAAVQEQARRRAAQPPPTPRATGPRPQKPQPEPAMGQMECRVLREGMGLSGEALAGLLGVQERTVRRWESGNTPIPAGVASEIRRLLVEFEAGVQDMTSGEFSATPWRTVTRVPFYATEADWLLANPASRYPYSWHRAMAAQAAAQLGGAPLVPIDVSGLGCLHCGAAIYPTGTPPQDSDIPPNSWLAVRSTSTAEAAHCPATRSARHEPAREGGPRRPARPSATPAPPGVEHRETQR